VKIKIEKLPKTNLHRKKRKNFKCDEKKKVFALTVVEENLTTGHKMTP
jgi:hypothetical protein